MQMLANPDELVEAYVTHGQEKKRDSVQQGFVMERRMPPSCRSSTIEQSSTVSGLAGV